MPLVIEAVPSLPGVTRFASDDTFPAPRLGIVGAIHGNEHCGLLAISKLGDELAHGRLALTKGTLYLVHGNPAATEQQRRYTRDGVDLNRVFDYRFVDELAPTMWELEHRRALELRSVFDGLDALLDLHSTTAPSPAFAIASRIESSEPFALALGLEYVTFGWDGPGMLGEQVLLSQLTRRGLPGVAVECGQHDAPESVSVAYHCARRALAYFGMAPLPSDEPPPPAPRRLRLRAAIKRPSPSFRFEEPIVGMQRLAPGTVIGHGDHVVMSVRNPCYAIMPNDDVPVGDDMLYLADEQ
jgi:succinylglutamate desuccinylase